MPATGSDDSQKAAEMDRRLKLGLASVAVVPVVFPGISRYSEQVGHHDYR